MTGHYPGGWVYSEWELGINPGEGGRQSPSHARIKENGWLINLEM